MTFERTAEESDVTLVDAPAGGPDNASLCAAMWQSAMGVVSKTDENGNFIAEACGQPNMKMARHFLEWQPEKWASVGRDTFRITLACLSSVVT